MQLWSHFKNLTNTHNKDCLNACFSKFITYSTYSFGLLFRQWWEIGRNDEIQISLQGVERTSDASRCWVWLVLRHLPPPRQLSTDREETEQNFECKNDIVTNLWRKTRLFFEGNIKRIQLFKLRIKKVTGDEVKANHCKSPAVQSEPHSICQRIPRQ